MAGTVRAIPSAIFFLGVTFAGCSPDLSRMDGNLEIAVLGVPIEAESVRATVRSEVGEVMREVALGAFSGQIIVERAPAGTPVEVVVEAIGSGATIESKVVNTEIAASGPTRIVVNLGAMEPPMNGEVHLDNTVNFFVRGIRDLTPSVAALTDPDYAMFLSTAESELGAPLSAIEIGGSIVIDFLDSSQGASHLTDLWSNPISVAIATQDLVTQIEVGETSSVGDDRATVVVTHGKRADLMTLEPQLLNGSFRLVLSGPMGDHGGGDLNAEVRVSVVFTAFAPAP